MASLLETTQKNKVFFKNTLESRQILTGTIKVIDGQVASGGNLTGKVQLNIVVPNYLTSDFITAIYAIETSLVAILIIFIFLYKNLGKG